MSNVFVIGGGASGMVAAIFAAERGHTVTILEHNDKLGKKLYATGNGKCNLTNSAFPPTCYRGGEESFVAAVLDAFSPEETKAFFTRIGLMLKEKRGYWYPQSEQAASVVSVLSYELRRLRVRIMTDCEVKKVERLSDGVTPHFQIEYVHKENGANVARADAVILACGGMAGQNLGAGDRGYRVAKSFGHTVTGLTPALVPLCTEERWVRSVSGVRLEVELTIGCDDDKNLTVREKGELVFADYGISGIPVMQLSRYAADWRRKGHPVHALIDLLPELSEDCLEANLVEHFYGERFEGRTAEEALCGILPKKLLYTVLKLSGIDPVIPVKRVTRSQVTSLVRMIKQLRVTVVDERSYEFAQVTAGGVRLEEVDPMTCESRLVEGLFFTGELLDVDGTCGGYNLQWAWSTGAIAGKSV